MRKIARYIYVGIAWLTLVGVIVPFFLAGMALFVNRAHWSSHAGIGWLSGWPLVGLMVFGLLGWIPRRLTAWLVGMTVLHAVHTILPSLQSDAPLVAAIHPVSALLLVAVTYWHARRATQLLLEPYRAPDETQLPIEPSPQT